MALGWSGGREHQPHSLLCHCTRPHRVDETEEHEMVNLNFVASCGVLIVFGGCGLCFAHHRFLTGQDGYARLNAWLEEGFLAGDEAGNEAS